MSDNMPSIFNDVIGPVMRGASSSHVVAAYRMGKLFYQAVAEGIADVLITVDTNSSLASTYYGHGSHLGLISGLLNLDITDERVLVAEALLQDQNIVVSFAVRDIGLQHPNHYNFEITSRTGKKYLFNGISTGGGMLTITTMDGYDVDIQGDYYELLIFCLPQAEKPVVALMNQVITVRKQIQTTTKDDCMLVHVKTSIKLPDSVIQALDNAAGVLSRFYLSPVLPVVSQLGCNVPFENGRQLQEVCRSSGVALWQAALQYESQRGGVSESEVFARMSDLVSIMRNSCKKGLALTEIKDNILPHQSQLIPQGVGASLLVPSPLINNIVKNVTAIMEAKSVMEIIVAAPTAGSCGCLPGTLLAMEETYGFSHEEITKGMLTAGLVGVLIAKRATFSAEVAGCQVECGAGSGMAAAAIAELFGGSVSQCMSAASMALQNITGLACDPVANRVEVPCLGKNIMCGVNAVAVSTMALAGYEQVIPLDETIDAIYDIGQKLPLELRCTCGGLGKTPASLELNRRLNG